MPDLATWHDRFDRISVADLRAIGGAKWSRFPDQIGSFIAEMDFGVHPAIVATLATYADSGLHGYSTSPWPEEMAAAYADFVQDRYGVTINAQWVEPITDVLAALEATLRTFTKADDPVVVISPAYMCFFDLLAAMGRPVFEVPLLADHGWAMDYAAIDAALTQGATSVLLCNPHNPTGRVYDRDELIALAEVVSHHNALVFSDEIHAPITFGGITPIPYASLSAQTAHHTVTATSASKAWNLPGLRCAQISMSDQGKYETYQAAMGPFLSDRVPNIGLFANTTAYREGRDWLDIVIPYLEANLDLLDEAIASGSLGGMTVGEDYQRPQGTYLTWLNAANTKACAPSAGTDGRHDPKGYIAAHAKVQVTPGHLCGTGYDSYIRLNAATPRPIWQETLERLAAVL